MSRGVVRFSRVLGGICSVLMIAGCSRPTSPDWGVTTDFGDVWGTSATDVYAIGQRSQEGEPRDLILHYDGRRWSASSTETPAYLTSMWGSSTDQFLVGLVPPRIQSGRIVHRSYNDGRWNTLISATSVELFDVWASSASDVYAVGSSRIGGGGAILHNDGNGWSVQNDTVAVRGVWGSSGSDVFAVGESILHYDGTSWSTQIGRPGYLFDAWGSSATDVFAVGGSGRILHYDGSGWSNQVSGTSAILSGVWGSSSNDVFAVGYDGTILHYDGMSWSRQASGTSADLQGVWGSSRSDVYAVGYEGTLLHYNGSSWSAVKWQFPLLPGSLQ